ncbi:endonuclease [Clostridium saccharoperbutylacetonicum]|uniref:endonuclease n=1 Tax=Clostridium saccharoperbutylacetonicum TaxID=36745 RepID=UPI000983D636|nr:endonuclease [Clostridium saccharoperbutylacetonicum]AQR93670.1 extracellular ribonuclease precursor [Clostridium saccharoperbutylacetonicum]NSB29369.1 endonuclease I/V8-like Glu-specific endopeptidase/endonuclease/exonuclease/phosphatase family metal-dependent hydrolase [Clostridium saccharoperbutylacetonicum]
MINRNNQIKLIGSECSLKNTNKLEPKAFNDLVKRRAMDILNIKVSNEELDNDDNLRKRIEKDIFEKIDGENNLLPIDFLYKAVEKAKAVCRISTPSGLGTGFLIDKGLLMTNNHVIENKEIAKESFAEFYYEKDKEIVKVNLKPDEIFITSPLDDLDFTIVSCDIKGIENIKPIHLMRSPITITRGEFVNIIQHPKARMKEISLQDNKVTYILDKLIRYNTDTEEGSSGSAVFNNKWELVALHHAGWYKDETKNEAINEGIRISAIVSRLITLANEGDKNSSKVLKTVEGTSPYLGFFDIAGVVQNQKKPFEIEIPSYKGDKKFADIGFWNIEHFNNGVSQKRIEDIAKVIGDLSMDVLGLEEVENAALDKLIKELRKSNINMNYVYLDTEGSQDLAVLFDEETTKVQLRKDINEKYKSILRSKTDLGKYVFPKRREPLFAKCIVDEDQKKVEFLMIVVHLKAFGDAESKNRRRLAANIISTIIEDLQNEQEFKDISIIIGGDFNQQLNEDVIDSLTKSPFLTTLTTDDESDGFISYIKNRKSLIDHIIVSNDIKLGGISNDDAAIVRLDKSMSNYVNTISDHVPLVMRLIYKDNTEIFESNSPLNFYKITKESNFEESLLKLKFNMSKLENISNYYDEEKDKLTINGYYSNINFNMENRKLLFNNLSQLVTTTHKNFNSYKKSRRDLFSWVDLREDGKIKSLYYGKSLEPEVLLKADFEIEKTKRQAYETFLKSEEYVTDIDKEEIMTMLEAQFNYNIEHSVPQSYFNKLNPMKSDMHHLFVCETKCNSFRDDDGYYDFQDYNPESNIEIIMNKCGKAEDEKFEPQFSKGTVARATLYFLLRYPEKIKESRKDRINIELLLKWHKDFPVSLYEKHRNKAIWEIQGNRNPFIDFPECAYNINFLI